MTFSKLYFVQYSAFKFMCGYTESQNLISHMLGASAIEMPLFSINNALVSSDWEPNFLQDSHCINDQ